MVAQKKKLYISSICIVTKYSENESSGNHSKRKRDRMNMSLLDAAHADARDNVQLEVEYIAF